MKTTEINEIVEKNLSRIKLIYSFSIVFGIIGLILNIIYKGQLVHSENALLFAWITAILVSIYYATYVFYYGYKKIAIQERDLIVFTVTTFIFAYILMTGLGKFFIEKGMQIKLPEIIFLLSLFPIQLIPLKLGERLAKADRNK